MQSYRGMPQRKTLKCYNFYWHPQYFFKLRCQYLNKIMNFKTRWLQSNMFIQEMQWKIFLVYFQHRSYPRYLLKYYR